MVKLMNFAIMCKANGGEPTVDLLRSFLNLDPAGDWLTLSNRGGANAPKALTKLVTHLERWKGSFFFIENKIIPSDYLELLLEDNKLDKNPLKTRFPYSLKSKDHPVRLRNVSFGVWLFLEMDFKRFMIQGVDGEFNFLPEGGLDKGQDSSSAKSMNNEILVVDTEPISVVHPLNFAENIIDSGNASHENDDLAPVGLSEPYDLEAGNTSKAAGKRKHIAGSYRGEGSCQRTQMVPPQESKVYGDTSTLLDVDSDPDIHEFPSAKELRNATDCHWVVAHVTSLSWKQHLREISLEQLCNIHDRAYLSQAVLENIKKDKAYAELEKKCNEALQDLDKNPLISDMRSKIETLQVNSLYNEYNRLVLEKKKCINYEQTLSTLHDMAVVVTKVVPDAAMKLIQSNEMGILIAKLAKASMFCGRCATLEEVANFKEPFVLEKMPGYRPSSKDEFDQAGDDLANASYPFLVELTVDPYASVEQLLSKKPQSLCLNHASSHSKPLSSKAPCI
ncbi:hypothetical protein Tco_0478494 [Tanacetum coccineum]